MTKQPPTRKLRRQAAAWALVSLALWIGACANYKFMRTFEPLLDKDLAIDRQYREFEDAQPSGHWQQNMSTLKGMVDAKTEILPSLKALAPNPENEELYRTLVEDINNSIAYLNKEITYFQIHNGDFAGWQTNYMMEGGEQAPAATKKEYLRAKNEVLRIQDELTAAGEKCNASQERLAKLLQEKKLRNDFQPIKYIRYRPGVYNFKIK